jgi:hypothetical protein
MTNAVVIELFEKIYNEAYISSKNALQVEINGENMDL